MSNSSIAETSASNANFRVLVVDDNAVAADTLAILLRGEGYEVDVTFGGRAALRRAEAHRPNAALVDISMPEMNGFELAGHLRRLSPNILVIGITGDAAQRNNLHDSPLFDHYFIKPADPDRLLDALRHWRQLLDEVPERSRSGCS